MNGTQFFERYSVYPKAAPPHVDCKEMRSLEDHLWHLAEVFRGVVSTDSGWGTETKRDFARVPQWLEMGAGLRYVDVDPSYGNPDASLCGTAAAYEAAHANTASVFVTEETRLLYVWNAAERFLRCSRFPPARGAKGNFNAATQRLKEDWDSRTPLPHFECVVRHLEVHLANDPELRGETTLKRALEEEPWRGRSGFALAFAHQLRHLPAHGDLDIPEPAGTWDHAGNVPADHINPLLHTPRHAARGLALSLQMLLSTQAETFSIMGSNAPWNGWWVMDHDGEWGRSHDPDLKQLAEQAHLSPPSREWDWNDEEED